MSASPEERFDAWTTENGLPNDAILAMRQTKDGYLWFSTGNGLVRFDGVRFRVYSTENTPALKSDQYAAFSLYQARDGALWAGTANRGVVRYQNGIFTALTKENGLPDDRIVRIDEDAEGTMWIFTRKGLVKWSDGHFVPQQSAYWSTPTERIGGDAIHLGLWRVTSTGWERFAFGRWSPFPLPPDITNVENPEIGSIWEDSERRVWYSIRHRPGEHYCVKDNRLVTFHGIPPQYFVSYQDRSGYLWLSDHAAHNARWKDGHLQLLRDLKTPMLFSAIEDHDKGLWIGTLSSGLYRFRTLPVTSFQTSGGPEVGPTLFSSSRQGTWIGSVGIAKYLNNKSVMRRNRDWDRNIVTAIEDGGDGTLWVGLRDGVERFRSGAFFDEPSLNHFLAGGVTVIHRDASGRVWFGCKDGLVSLHNGEFRRLTEMDGLPGNEIKTLLEDAKGALWIGTSRGLGLLKNDHLSIVPLIPAKEVADISAFYLDAAGTLWVGTDGQGLFRIQNGQVRRITSKQSPGLNMALRILEDNQGFLWIGSQDNLLRARKKEVNECADGRVSGFTTTRFNRADGLLGVDFRTAGQPAVLKNADGRLWFATPGGVSVIDPAIIPSHPNRPSVVIENCSIEHEVTPCANTVSLKPDENSLEIQYTALNSPEPDQIRFKYKMDDLDNEWTDAGTRRTAYYSHLPPGTYTFQITAANSDGIWNPNVNRLKIIMHPHFYVTWWFRGATLLGITVALILAWQRRLSQMRHTHTLQRTFSQRLIASQESERKRIAAELHDSLGQRLIVIKNLAALCLQRQNEHRNVNGIVREALEALDDVKTISYNLRPYQLDRLGLTRALDSMMKTVASASAIDFVVTLDNIDGVFLKELEINFYRIVQEALNNVVKHSGATKAHVMILREENHILLTIHDNGKGILASRAEGFVGMGGLGLTGIEERAELLGGKAYIDSAATSGTTIRVEITVGRGLHERHI